MDIFQKFFAIAVENPHLYHSGVLCRILSNYPEGEKADEELRNLYRNHRASRDEELYGVKFKDVVKGTEGAKPIGINPLPRIDAYAS